MIPLRRSVLVARPRHDAAHLAILTHQAGLDACRRMVEIAKEIPVLEALAANRRAWAAMWWTLRGLRRDDWSKARFMEAFMAWEEAEADRAWAHEGTRSMAMRAIAWILMLWLADNPHPLAQLETLASLPALRIE